ncbi:vacuolar sorting protein Vps68 [Schizosaccharomyces japonicus yFS275]|uniref:Vacuolar sorting protein Vps68 n=1 Tax=Schizosaccharomyces japonicus (strain yFS275 / FY16936) TaxID=402676 RepID=B6K4F5_SCHJY|nr:vacuolar sorting protein Vps68 [Schizosaccharomyces japonicus yFS275]EEB08362.2 vacuolar sorting protein Vps68 [Schizosaccharomyces japonicus yFS275]
MSSSPENGGGLFRFRFSSLHLSYRNLGVYSSGVFFASGIWVFINACLTSKLVNGGDVHVEFEDWVPFLCSLLGMIIVNSVDKSRLSGDSFAYTDENIASKARLILFIGFSLLASGLAGSFTVFILKYLMNGYQGMTLWLGLSNIISNILLMISASLLWVTGNMNDDYHYNLQL